MFFKKAPLFKKGKNSILTENSTQGHNIDFQVSEQNIRGEKKTVIIPHPGRP